MHHLSATKFGHNFHAISGSDQRWHRSSESEGTVCSCESFVFRGDFLELGRTFASLSYGWIEREVGVSAGICHPERRTVEAYKFAEDGYGKAKGCGFQNPGLACEPGAHGWFVGSFLNRQVLLCLQSLPFRTRQPKPVRRLGTYEVNPTVFLQLEKNTFKNPGCTGRGDACHCQGVFFFRKKHVDTPNC